MKRPGSLFGLTAILLMNAILSPQPGFSDADFKDERERMVADQIQARGVTDKRVLAAMRKVKRHLFVPSDMQLYAYNDSALPIAENQTISQPYIVALMTELAQIKPQDKVLEIGTGSGYQAAILAELADKVYTIEINKRLCEDAGHRLQRLGYKNIEIKHGDGYRGWPEAAPFDAIIVTAAPRDIPKELIAELKRDGRMVLPKGDFFQDLYVVTRNDDGSIKEQRILSVRFVPMTGGGGDAPDK